jgi:hypothetical protein
MPRDFFMCSCRRFEGGTAKSASKNFYRTDLTSLIFNSHMRSK